MLRTARGPLYLTIPRQCGNPGLDTRGHGGINEEPNVIIQSKIKEYFRGIYHV
jgi:hypothetical protein